MNKKVQNSFSLKFLFLLVLLWSSAFLLEGGKEAWASPDLDRKFSLTQIGILRAWDNVDGLFGDLVSDVCENDLKEQSRFVVHRLTQANEILSASTIPYQKLIEDADVLGQIAKQQKLNSLLRTKVYKEGPEYRFVMDWIYVPGMQVLATETFKISEPFTGDKKLGSQEFHDGISRALERLIQKIPFVGMVTGRDQKSLTINMGQKERLKKGDTLVIATLDEAQVHPLLNTIVNWRLTTTGKATVVEVDEGMAFAQIDSEEYGRQIARFQKIVQVIPGQAPTVDVHNEVTDLEERLQSSREPPRVGWVSPGLLIGKYSREASSSSGTAGVGGSGTTFGVKAESQLWFTSDWFGELNYAYGSSNYTQTTKMTASLSQIRAAIGYFYHITPNFFGPKGWAKFGYHHTRYGLPLSVAEKTSDVSYSGILIGLGGDLPIRDDFGVILSLDFGLFGSGKESGSYYGTDSGASAVDVTLGGYVWLKPKMKFLINFDFKSHSLDFVNGSTLSNKVLSIGPSLMFYF